MSKHDKPKKFEKPAKKELPFEKFRKKQPDNGVLGQAASRAVKARVRSFNTKQDEDHIERWINSDEPRTRKRLYVPKVNEDATDEAMRLNKYLAHAGVASRRKADELIKAGKVTVNGMVVTEMGHRLQTNDKVHFEGRLLNPEPKVYILLNKPKDYITTTNDERERKTVMELVKGAYEKIKSPKKLRLYPVGRLDRNTTGVLLITNDGELTQQLVHPSSEVKKVYHVFLDKKLKESDFEKIADGGVVLEDGIVEVDAIAYPNPKSKSEVGIEIHSGRNRVVRRIFEALGYEVVKLDRVFFAGLTKKDMPRGKWRFLSEQEVRMLKHFTLGKQEEEKKKPAKGKPASKPFKPKTEFTDKPVKQFKPKGEFTDKPKKFKDASSRPPKRNTGKPTTGVGKPKTFKRKD